MASWTHPRSPISEIMADLMPSRLSFQHLGLGRSSRTLMQEWPFIRRTVESILNRKFDTCLHSAILLMGLGNSRVHAGGPKIIFIAMMQQSDAREWPEVADEIQEFLDTIRYGIQVRMEYDGVLGCAIQPSVRRQRPLTRRRRRL